MIKGAFQTIKRFLPEKLKVYFYLFKRQNFFSYLKIKSQIKKKTNVRLLIGYEGKKEGWFSLGFGRQNDICLNKKINKIKICIPNNCVNEVYIDDFLRRLNNKQLHSLLNEIFRILMPNGLLKTKFLNAGKAIDIFIKNSSYFTGEQFWNKEIINDKPTPLNILSYLLFQKESRHLLDTDVIISLLKKYKFNIIKTDDIGEIFSVVVSKKYKNVSYRVSTRLSKTCKDQKDMPVYLYNCDSLFILEKFKKINLFKLQGRNFFSVIGSLFFINLLPYLRPEKIYLFDINEYQTRYMRVFVDIVKHSNNLQEFLENFFSRKYQTNISKFFRSPFDKTIYNKNLERTQDREIFEMTLGKIAYGKYVLLDNIYPALKISNNSLCQHILIMSQELFIPGPEANIMVLQEGLAENFNYIKEKLIKDTIIKTDHLEDLDISYFNLQNDNILYVSNIGEDDWLYGNLMDQDLDTIQFQSWLLGYPRAVKKQIIESFSGFHKFIKRINRNFWIIDSKGNIFNSQELLKERSDSHEWLWQKIRPLIMGDEVIELIHTKKASWGFKEHLNTININDYLRHFNKKKFSTIILHMLLSNQVNLKSFIEALKIASRKCRRIIILEHDKDSVNFGIYSGHNILDIRTLLKILRSIPEIEKSEIKICWSGASYRVDGKKYGNKANFNRNFIILIDL